MFTRLALWRHQRRRQQIGDLEPTLLDETDSALRKRSLTLRYRAKTGEKPSRLMNEAFALVREAARRTIGLRHFDVQLIGGMVLCRRGLAEMQTGEGKTLTASLPLYLYALYGRGALLATVNDYLARRDAEWIGPVYELLGLTVGVVESPTPPPDRRRAYDCDITYGTAKEFGFDFLRDRLLIRRLRDAGRNTVGRLAGTSTTLDEDRPLQRDPFFMLVDEADSVLVDDAGTPLIIAEAPRPASALDAARYRWAVDAAARLHEPEHYTYKHEQRRIELTTTGRQAMRGLPQLPILANVGWSVLYEDVERALLVARLYQRDRQYVIRNGEVQIVDEFTGRVAEGRKWQEGIHQAIEARENIDITDDGGQAARVTVQDFFRRFRFLAGMTGTIGGDAAEVRGIYRLRAAPIPTNKPPIRQALPTRIFGTADAKWHAVVAEVVEMHASGRPVLVGTRSIDKSERLSALLHAAGIEHEVLNARHEAREAQIVAEAGGRGRVTVATNMAGRGTDIKLGVGVHELGGLHVIMTEMHDASRIDRQLIGRCGRQGDPGSYRIYLALDDELLLQGFGPQKSERWKKYGLGLAQVAAADDPGAWELPSRYERMFRRAQRAVERHKYRGRRRLLWYERHRRKATLPLGLDPHIDLP